MLVTPKIMFCLMHYCISILVFFILSPKFFHLWVLGINEVSVMQPPTSIPFFSRYFLPVTYFYIGNPPQRIEFLFDSGSDIVSTFCYNVLDESQHAHRQDLHFMSSKTFYFQSCSEYPCYGAPNHNICSTLENWMENSNLAFSYINLLARKSSNFLKKSSSPRVPQNICGFVSKFVAAPTLTGAYYQDQFRLNEKSDYVNNYMTCSFNETDRPFSIAGLSYSLKHVSAYARPNYSLPQVLYNSNLVATPSFSTCFSPNNGGILTFGSLEEQLVDPNLDSKYNMVIGKIDWHDLLADANGSYNFFKILVKQLKVDNVVINVSPLVALIDTGSNVSIFPEVITQNIFFKLSMLCQTLPLSTNMKCRVVSGRRLWYIPNSDLIDQTFPSISFSVDSIEYKSFGSNYLKSLKEFPHFYTERIISDPKMFLLDSSMFLVNRFTIFDMQLNRLGIAEADCPTVSEADFGDAPPVGPIVWTLHVTDKNVILIVGIVVACTIAIFFLSAVISNKRRVNVVTANSSERSTKLLQESPAPVVL